MSGRRGGGNDAGAARRACAWLFLAAAALGGCETANADEEGRAPANPDWQARVAEARKYAERRKKERANVVIQSAIGVQVIAGEPSGGGAARPPGAPRVTVVSSNLAPEEVARVRDRARNAVGVVVYTTAWCGVCSVARDHMHERGIAFVERDVDKRVEWKRRLLALNARGSVPTFDVDGLVMVGFGEEQLDQLIARASEARLQRLLRGPKTILVSQP